MKSTTAFDDQFTPATQTIESVRHPYDTSVSLSQNYANLELALKQQTIIPDIDFVGSLGK